MLGCDECFHIPTWYVNTLFCFSIIQVFGLNQCCFGMSTMKKQYVHIQVWSKVCTRSVCTNTCKSGFVVTGVKSTHSLDPPPFWYDRAMMKHADRPWCHADATSTVPVHGVCGRKLDQSMMRSFTKDDQNVGPTFLHPSVVFKPKGICFIPYHRLFTPQEQLFFNQDIQSYQHGVNTTIWGDHNMSCTVS